jgi:hypothetical protein
VTHRSVFPFFSVPSCTAPRHSTSLTSTSHRLLPRRYTQKRFSTTHAPSSRIPSTQTKNSLRGPSPRSSPRLFWHRGPSSLYWYVVPPSHHVVPLLSVTDDTLWVVLVVGSRAPRCSSPLLAQRALFCTLTRSHRRPPFLVLDRASSRGDPFVWLGSGHTFPTHG